MALCSVMKPLTLSPYSPSDFNYNTDGYEADGAEDVKSQDGSETLPYIDESPTMSPQLCMPQGPDGETVSPTPPEGLLHGVRPAALLHTSTFRYNFILVFISGCGRWEGEGAADITHNLDVSGLLRQVEHNIVAVRCICQLQLVHQCHDAGVCECY